MRKVPGKKERKLIASERIKILIEEAEKVIASKPKYAQLYIELARKIAMKARVKLPPTWKKRICKKCKTILIPGFNARVRLRNNRFPHITIKCFECGNYTRHPYKLRERHKN